MDDLLYIIDGSFDGLMCAVYESVTRHELPYDIVSESSEQISLFSRREIFTDKEIADRVTAAVRRRISSDAYQAARLCFLTCNERRYMLILKFILLGFKYGGAVTSMLADDVVSELMQSVNHLTREAHLYKGFVRFSISGGVLAAKIEPKNVVLPLLRHHFCDRFSGESFLIYDATHEMALIYRPHEWRIISVTDFSIPVADGEELQWRNAWRSFYDAIEIKERHNPKCRMSNIPKRYWGCMTEFCRDDAEEEKIEKFTKRLLT